MATLIPREIVSELDFYVIGQNDAKKCVSIALRNRWRLRQVPKDLRDEIVPKNIIMIGPTGVGKTEIARRLARLANAPFLKVEASKFTEVGYVGRDVESMIRDLTELAVKMVKEEERNNVQNRAKELAEKKLLDLLLPPSNSNDNNPTKETTQNEVEEKKENNTRNKLKKLFYEGKLDERYVEIETNSKPQVPMIEVFASSGLEDLDTNIKDLLSGMLPQKNKRRKVKISEAMEFLIKEEANKLIDMDQVVKNALIKVQKEGIIFLDELDKIAGRSHSYGPDVSREGVQRDLLPLVEGSSVNTKYGIVQTDHILFIAAGAFHMNRPSDLVPELQGRFPIRVELKSLSEKDFIQILTEPKNALIKQYTELLKTEGIKLSFSKNAIKKIADIAFAVNNDTENIGARRLHTVMECLLEEISFNAPECIEKEIYIDSKYVIKKLTNITKNQDLSRYIL